MVLALSMPPRQLTLSGLPGWPGDRVSEHSDSLIAETPPSALEVAAEFGFV